MLDHDIGSMTFLPILHDLLKTYKQLYLGITTYILPGPRSWSYFITPILLPIALSVTPYHLSHSALKSFLFPLMTACTVHAWIVMECVDVASLNVLLWSAYLIFINDARTDFARVITSDPYQNSLQSSSEESYPVGIFARTQWVASLVCSTRMNGWRLLSGKRRYTELVYVTRTQFAVSRLLHLMFNILSLAVILDIALNDQWFERPNEIPISSSFSADSFFLHKSFPRLLFQPRLIRALVIGGYIYNYVTIFFNLYTPSIVLSNFLFQLPPDEWSPHRASPYFGSFVSGVLEKGLAGLWGTWWHQHMRVFFSAPGKAVADRLGMRKDSASRYILLVSSAFFFSGITHMGLVPRLPIILTARQNLNEHQVVSRAWILRLKIAGFFWVQPFGIMLELMVGNVLFATLSRREMQPFWMKFLLRILRFLWVLGWLCMTLPLFGEPLAGLGYWRVWKMSLADLDDFLCNGYLYGPGSACSQYRSFLEFASSQLPWKSIV